MLLLLLLSNYNSYVVSVWKVFLPVFWNKKVIHLMKKKCCFLQSFMVYFVLAHHSFIVKKDGHLLSEPGFDPHSTPRFRRIFSDVEFYVTNSLVRCRKIRRKFDTSIPTQIRQYRWPTLLHGFDLGKRKSMSLYFWCYKLE